MYTQVYSCGLGTRHQHGPHNVLQSNAFSHAAAAFNTVTSSNLRPTSIIAVGSFTSTLSAAGTNPQGSDKAGWPVAVCRQYGTCRTCDRTRPYTLVGRREGGLLSNGHVLCIIV